MIATFRINAARLLVPASYQTHANSGSFKNSTKIFPIGKIDATDRVDRIAKRAALQAKASKTRETLCVEFLPAAPAANKTPPAFTYPSGRL